VQGEIEEAFRPYLRARERVVWAGLPQQGVRFGPQDTLLIPFSMLWGGFAIFWEATAFRTGAPGFFDLWGIPFVAIGLYMIFGRFLVDAWVRARTVYAITDQRALVLRRVLGERLLTADLGGAVEVKRGSGGRGVLTFGGRSPGLTNPFGFGGGWGRRSYATTWTPALSSQVQFLGIGDVMTAYQAANRSAPAP
jgi:hypothetical protein